MTKDFSFPSEDNTGQFNELIAKKTRETITMHQEMEGKPIYPTSEIRIEFEGEGKKKRKKRDLRVY